MNQTCAAFWTILLAENDLFQKFDWFNPVKLKQLLLLAIKDKIARVSKKILANFSDYFHKFNALSE